MTFHNTTEIAGPALTQARLKTAKQDEVVMATFRALSRAASPSEILEASGLRCPLTSIRRSITNLTTAGALEKTDRQRTGPYGRSEFLWRLPAGQLPLFN